MPVRCADRAGAALLGPGVDDVDEAELVAVFRVDGSRGGLPGSPEQIASPCQCPLNLHTLQVVFFFLSSMPC